MAVVVSASDLWRQEEEGIQPQLEFKRVHLKCFQGTTVLVASHRIEGLFLEKCERTVELELH